MNGAFFLKLNNKKLFAFMHSANVDTSSKTAIIICSPHAEEKITSHRVLYNLANSLSNAGFDTLRFDYYGHGDSEGNFSDITIESMVDDVNSVKTFLMKSGASNIYLIGCRLGGTIASLSAAAKQSNISKLILINPIINLSDYLNECLRGNLSSQFLVHKKVIRNTKKLIQDIQSGENINFFGYELTKRFYDGASSINLDSVFHKLTSPILHVEIKKQSKDSNNSESHSQIPNATFMELPGILFWNYNKRFIDNFDSLNKTTLDWILEH